MNISRDSPGELLSASLLPTEIVRKKSMQVEKIDWVVDQLQEARRRGDVTVWAVPVAAEDRIASRKTVNQYHMSRIGMS
jgi:hypothetical protein